MGQVEDKILEIIKTQGGAVSTDFFARTMRDMVKKGLLETHFPKNKVAQMTYEYHIKKGG